MSLLRCSACILLLASTAPSTVAGAFDDLGGYYYRSAAGSADAAGGCGNAAHEAGDCGNAAHQTGGRGEIDASVSDAAPVPVRAAELRVFALYGRGELSSFSSVVFGSHEVGETTSHGEPLDWHAEDPWLGVDKVQHLTFSFLFTLGTQYVAVNKGDLSESRALPLSIGTSAVIGLTKEYYDLRRGPPNVFSYKDLIANGVGILLAAGIILL